MLARRKWSISQSKGLTGISHTDSDVSSTHICSVECECLFQAVKSGKLDISKSFRLAIHLVLNNSNAGDVAVLEEIRHISLGCVKGHVAEMCSVWRLSWEGKLFSD